MAQTGRADTPRNRGESGAPHVSPITPAEDARTIMINRAAWGAVLAGVVLSLVAQLILNMFGVGIGAATLDPGTGDNPSASSFSIGAGLWFAASGVFAAFVGGYVAGRLSGAPKESTAGWHGLTTWAVTTLVIFYLLTTAVGGLLGGAYRTVASTLGGVASSAGSVAQTAAQVAAPNLPRDPFSSIEQSLRGASGSDPAQLRDAAIAAVRGLVTGDPQRAQDGRERAAQAIAKAQNIPEDQARAEVQKYEQQYRQAVNEAKQRATRAADAAARTLSLAALFSVISLLLGAIAAWFGGRMGAVEPTETALVGYRS
jgi:hypothetical protein